MKKRRSTIVHRFVESVPDTLEDGIVYVSIPFATVVHKCCCGCGQEVVTPLGKREWTLSFNGEAISLHPSIGNWSFACQSHYWLRSNNVQWAGQMSKKQVDAMRARERQLDLTTAGFDEVRPDVSVVAPPVPSRKPTLWSRVTTWLRGQR